MIKNQIEELTSQIYALGRFIESEKKATEFSFSEKLLTEIALGGKGIDLLNEIRNSFCNFILHDFGELNWINAWATIVPDIYQKHTLIGKYPLKSVDNSLMISLNQDRSLLRFYFYDESIIYENE